jgi:hypothetical protein
MRLAPSPEAFESVSVKEDEVSQWKESAGKALRQIRTLEEQVREQERRAEDYEAVTEAELEKCVALATDLPSLIERARQVPFGLQRIVESLASEVRLRKLAPGIYELRIVFPSGESVVRIFRDYAPKTSHALQVLASESIAEGRTREAIAAELAKYSRVSGRQRQVMKPDHVQTAALVHRYFETEHPRDGDHRTPEEIAGAVGRTADWVMSLALEGRLGPARWRDGGLVLCPTDRELHKCFPEFARAEVARVNGLRPEHLVSTSDLYRANRRDPRIDYFARFGKEMFRDAGEGLYMRRTDADELGLAIVPNQDETEETRRALEGAVAALGKPGLNPRDFHPVAEILQHLGPRFTWVTAAVIRKAVEVGKIPGVRCLGLAVDGSLLPDLLHVYAPAPVLEATADSVLETWLPRPRGLGRWSPRRERARSLDSLAVRPADRG